MTRPRSTWGQALKAAAVKLAREAERYVGGHDEAPCVACSHARSQHCGCGTVCLAPADPTDTGKVYRCCECQGFAPKAEG
jgi:hypothetical protein